MKKVLALIAVLVLASSSMAASVSLSIGNATGTMTLDQTCVVWNDNANVTNPYGGNTYTGQVAVYVLYQAQNGVSTQMSAIGSEMWLQGTNAGSLTPDNFLSSYPPEGLVDNGDGTFGPGYNPANATDVSNLVSPKTFLFANWNDVVTSDVDASAPGSGAVTFDLDTTGTKTSQSASDVGKVVAVYFFDYNGPHANLGALDAYLGADNSAGTGSPYMNSGSPSFAVGNDGININTPEPATMGLLGLGLVGLIARRKKA